MSSSFVVSDLARQRREVVDAARHEPVLIRDTDGLMLVLKTEDHERERDEILRLYELCARADIEFRSANPSVLGLGEVAYIADWTPERQRWYFDGLMEALAESRRLGRAEPARFFIRYNAPFADPLPTAIDRAFTERLGRKLAQHVKQ
jgi:hypothetical protein